jgi:hypothetical protein
MCIPPGKVLGTPMCAWKVEDHFYVSMAVRFCSITIRAPDPSDQKALDPRES